MFFKKKKEFKLETEDNLDYFKYDEDDDYFRFEDEKEDGTEEVPASDDKLKDSYFDNTNIDFDKVESSSETDDDKHRELIPIINKVLDILLILVIVGAVMIIFDVVMLTRFEKGPFFAIKTKEYKDGGTKVYSGIGYKVIKYNQIDGRHDTVVGNYKITYSSEKYETSLVDLAIKFRDNIDDAQELLYKYIIVSGNVGSIDKKNKIIRLIYKDTDSKYQTVLTCEMDEDFDDFDKIVKNKEIKVDGTLYNYDINGNIKLYLKNCYAKE